MKSDFKFSNLCGTVYKQGNLIFTPDGNTLLSPVGNRVTQFDLIDNKSITLPFETNCNIVKMALSKNGNLLFVADEEGSGLLINLARRFILHRFNFDGRVNALSFSPDGKYFAFGIDRFIEVWKVPGAHRELVPFVKFMVNGQHYDTVTCLNWSSDSKYLISGSMDMTCKIHSIGNKNEENKDLKTITLSGHKDSIVGCYFSLDQQHVYTISKDGVCLDWQHTSIKDIIESKGESIEEQSHLNDQQLTDRKWLVYSRNYFEQKGSKVISCQFHLKTNLLLVGFSKGTFGIWELPEFVNIHTLSISQTKIDTVDINESGEWLAFGTTKYGQLLVWEWQSESYILKQQGHYFDMNCMSYSKDGQLVCTGGQDGKLKLWDLSSGFSYVTFNDHQGPISQVLFAKQSQIVVSSSLDGTVRAFDLLRYRNFRTFTTPEPVQFSCLAVDSSGEIVCAGCLDTFDIYIWSMQSGKLLDVLSGHTGPISCMEFSPTDNLLATGSWDKSVRVWDAFDRGQSVELMQIESDVLALTYRPDGNQLAVASLDGHITFWDPKEGTQNGSIDGRHDISGGRKSDDKITAEQNSSGKSFNSLCYTADGDCLIGGGNSKYVCIYDAITSVLVKKFQITRNKSLDGTKEKLNSKFMTEAGNLEAIDDEDDDPSVNMKYRKDHLPGVQTGDLSKRRTRPEARTKSVKFSPTNSNWACVSTEGLLLYSLNDQLLFDPYDLELDITPESIRHHTQLGHHAKALIMSLRLNEKPLIIETLEHIPPKDIQLISNDLPIKYLLPMLKLLSTYLDSNKQHLQFGLMWSNYIIITHAKTIQNNINQYLPCIRQIQKNLKNLFDTIQNVKDDNLYLIHYLNGLKSINDLNQNEDHNDDDDDDESTKVDSMDDNDDVMN